MLCFVPVLRGCAYCYVRKKAFLQCLQFIYEMPLSMSFLGFGMGTVFANFHMCGIMLLLRAVLNILVRNASPIRHMCFRCLMFNLSGPCELLFLLCGIASRT